MIRAEFNDLKVDQSHQRYFLKSSDLETCSHMVNGECCHPIGKNGDCDCREIHLAQKEKRVGK
jgi:hypothetical protein